LQAQVAKGIRTRPTRRCATPNARSTGCLIPWYKHSIYAPGKYTGYAAVVIPGVNEAIDAGDATLTQQQLQILTDVLNRAAATLEKGM
jgi:hypothetical protein